eukprot:SAG22_NODE_1012_length_6040_cov_4.791449_1_plen_67_part_00
MSRLGNCPNRGGTNPTQAALTRLDRQTGRPVLIDTATETILVTVLLFVLPADWAAAGYGPAGGGQD